MSVKYGSESPHWKGGRIKRTCLVCSKQFLVDPNVVIKGFGKFCSKSCTAKRTYGRKPLADRVYFKCIICGKEFSDYKSKCVNEPNRGKCCSKECRVKYTKNQISGSKQWQWKGDKVGYGAAHQRLPKILGRPRKCSHCGTTTAKKYEWASLTKRYYDPKDYIRLCSSCHQDLDGHGWKYVGNNR
jgi:hypothetical protein